MVLGNKLLPWTLERGSPPSPQDLQQQHLDDILRYVSSFIRPVAEAEDVTMEVFHAAFLNLHRLKNESDPKLWLLGIARRKVADNLRRKYRRREIPLSKADQEHHSAQAQVETSALVSDLLEQMPQDHREVLVLKYSNGLSTQEVADVIGRSEAATNSLLQRAREGFYAKGAPLFLDQEETK